MTIHDYRTRYSDDRLKIENSELYKQARNDANIVALANALAKKQNGKVFLIHDDIGMSLLYNYENNILLRNYMANRTTSNNDYETILNLDEEYSNLEQYRIISEKLNLDDYLLNGMTLLINCLRCNENDKKQEQNRDYDISSNKRYKKLDFLLSCGADPNKTDSSRYCLTPLSHCVQMNDFRAFCTLLEHGADYNKGSIDETTPRNLKMQNVNEGNTPLMIACWHGNEKFVKKLCGFSDISFNQQDSNGYTALIKCAVQRYNRKK